MTLHRLQIDGVCLTARVRESLDSVTINLTVNIDAWYACLYRVQVDDWLMGPGGVLDQVTAEARAVGKYVCVLDPQHIMAK